LFILFALVLAIALPYGEWDAMSFGVWSRLIAEHWPHLHFAEASATDYQRPLFYVVQGTAWALFGFHESIGKTLSLLFSLLLLASMAWLAARTVRIERRFAAALAVIVVLLIAAFERYVAAGLSDVPAAAMVAVTAALVVAPRLGRFRLPLVAIAAALAVLSKPTTIAALAGLCCAVLIGRRAELRRRLSAAVALVLGIGLGLVYDAVQASYVHTSLKGFLTTGTSDGFYAKLADENRRRVLLDAGWLGNDLRVVLGFAVVYAVCRLVMSHRRSVAIAFVVAIAWSWLGPHLAGADGVRVGLLASGGWVQQSAAVVLAGSLLLALRASAESIPGRLQLARALVWATPPFIVWALRVVYDNRLLSPAWPALVLLIVWALLPVFSGARNSRRWLVLAPACALVT
jgi:4-amino-4-deoxy-L-arabinose transferase-like glycosyltransferase